MEAPPAPASAPARREAAAAVLLVLAAIALVHGPRVADNLSRRHWEDSRFFRHNKMNVHGPVDCFTQRSVWPGLYRPLTTNCYYLAGRVLFDNRIEIYHLVNVALMVANALLLWLVARRWLGPPFAVLAALLFASRSAHGQLATYTSEFQALFTAFWMLLALLLATGPGGRRRDIATSGCVALALLSKETSIVLPAVLTVAALAAPAPPSGRRLAGPWLVALGWAVLFVTVIRGLIGAEPTGFAYDLSPAVAARYAAYALTFSNRLVHGEIDVDMPARIVDLSARGLVVAVFVALALAQLGVLAWSAWARIRADEARLPAPALRVGAVGFAWFLLGAAPFVVLADRLFLRYAYAAHAGLALMLAAWTMGIVGRIRAANPPSS